VHLVCYFWVHKAYIARNTTLKLSDRDSNLKFVFFYRDLKPKRLKNTYIVHLTRKLFIDFYFTLHLSIWRNFLSISIPKPTKAIFFFSSHFFRQFHQHFTYEFFVQTLFFDVHVAREKLLKRRLYFKIRAKNVDEIDT